MRALIERKEAKECIAALEQRYMRQAVASGISDEERKEAAIKYQVLTQVVADLANYEPEQES